MSIFSEILATWCRRVYTLGLLSLAPCVIGCTDLTCPRLELSLTYSAGDLPQFHVKKLLRVTLPILLAPHCLVLSKHPNCSSVLCTKATIALSTSRAIAVPTQNHREILGGSIVSPVPRALWHLHQFACDRPPRNSTITASRQAQASC